MSNFTAGLHYRSSTRCVAGFGMLSGEYLSFVSTDFHNFSLMLLLQLMLLLKFFTAYLSGCHSVRISVVRSKRMKLQLHTKYIAGGLVMLLLQLLPPLFPSAIGNVVGC